MYRNNKDRNIEIKDNVKGGDGSVIFNHIAFKEEMYEKVKMYASITLKKGCGIGKHMHENEKEIICIIKGEATYFDDDKEYLIREGDVMICEDGHEHGISNHNDEDVIFNGLIIVTFQSN